MFVRFQQQGNRLQPSLMQSRRVGGKPRSEHIASLGSVDVDLSLRGRLAFWSELTDRLARLGPEDHDKIIGALLAPIPIVTVEEQRQIKKENAEEDERFWTDLRNKNASLCRRLQRNGRPRRIEDRRHDARSGKGCRRGGSRKEPG
jgi:hypothetical protein